MLTVMLLDHFGAAGGLQRSELAGLATEVDDIGLELLLEIEGIAFQIFDVEEHSEPPPAMRRIARGARQEALRLSSGQA